MSSSKKRKLTGLDGVALQLAYERLVDLQNTFVFEEADEEASGSEETFTDYIAATIYLLESRLEGPEGHNFIGVSEESLTRIGITLRGRLASSKDIEKVEELTRLGSTSLWCADNFHKQLIWLQRRVANTNEACRLWIDAFMFRAASMLEDKHVVLNLDHKISKTFIGPDTESSLAGFVDYVSLVCSDESFTDTFLTNPTLVKLGGHSWSPGVMVIEARCEDPVGHVAQALLKMSAAAKQIRKRFIRGAVTSGHKWIFLHLAVDESGVGGEYYQSATITLSCGLTPDGEVHLNILSANYIAAILSTWMEKGLQDFEETEGLLKICGTPES